MAKRISDALLGGFTGGAAGAGALGGLGQAGLIAGAAVNPWAWGLIGGGAALGGISSLLSEEDPQEELIKEQTKLLKQQNARRGGTARSLGHMFTGAKQSLPMSSERLV